MSAQCKAESNKYTLYYPKDNEESHNLSDMTTHYICSFVKSAFLITIEIK